MTIMADLNHYVGNDLNAGVIGDLATVTGITRSQQRILRRLLTNPGDYIFQPDYGAGLPGKVGQLMDVQKIKALIRSQMLLEESVAPSPAPVITVSQLPTDLNSLSVTIQYTDADTKLPTVLAFTVSN